MTTHKQPASGKPVKHGGKDGKERATRPEPQRPGPDRTGASAAASPSGNGGAQQDGHHLHHKAAGDSSSSVHIDEAVAEAVRTGYDVLSETISQGRRAAEMFRQGNFNIREVPSDIEALAHRLLDLARQLSSTTFDICEQLLSQASLSAGPPPPGETAATVPNFRDLKPSLAKGEAPPSSTTGHSHAAHHKHDTPKLPLAFRFVGRDKVIARAEAIDRPLKPTGAWEISATPLVRQATGDQPLTNVTFEADLSGGGLVVTIKVPEKQPSGVYSGMVMARNQDMPLGFLVVEVQD